MGDHDLTAFMATQLDRHLMFPLLKFLEERQLYKDEEIIEAKIRLLNVTNMVDYAMDIHKSLHDTDDAPTDMVARHAEVLARLKSLARPQAPSSPSSRTRSSCRSSGATSSTTSTCSKSGSRFVFSACPTVPFGRVDAMFLLHLMIVSRQVFMAKEMQTQEIMVLKKICMESHILGLCFGISHLSQFSILGYL
jgi:hypothetical protein